MATLRLREAVVRYTAARDAEGQPIAVQRQILDSKLAESAFRALLGDSPVEIFGVLMLDNRRRVIAYHAVSMGTANSSYAIGRDVYRAAVACNALSIICAHNHPSGDPTPSSDDVRVTAILKDAGAILGIELLDHLIIGEGAECYSFRQDGRL